jgi:predicted transcriptional regulator
MMLDSLEKEILDVLEELGNADIKTIHNRLKHHPYTTIASALERLFREGIVRRKEVKSRGKLGRKYVYWISDPKEAVARKLVENFVKLFGGDLRPLEKELEGFLARSVENSVAFVDYENRIRFLFVNGRVVEEVVGKNLFDFHSGMDVDKVKQLLDEMRNGRRVALRKVELADRKFHKFYCRLDDSSGNFLGVLIITLESSALEKEREQVINPF